MKNEMLTEVLTRLCTEDGIDNPLWGEACQHAADQIAADVQKYRDLRAMHGDSISVFSHAIATDARRIRNEWLASHAFNLEQSTR